MGKERGCILEGYLARGGEVGSEAWVGEGIPNSPWPPRRLRGRWVGSTPPSKIYGIPGLSMERTEARELRASGYSLLFLSF